MQKLLKELIDIKNHCNHPRWDGYSAATISEPSWEKAYSYAQKLPDNRKLPNVTVERHTGFVSFSWGSIKRNYVSIKFIGEAGDKVSCMYGGAGHFNTNIVSLSDKSVKDMIGGLDAI